jgi:hypothetical protein
VAHRLGEHLFTTSGRVARNHGAVHVLVIAEKHVSMALLVVECSGLMSRRCATAERGLGIIEPQALMPHVELIKPPVVWSNGRKHIALQIEGIIRPARTGKVKESASGPQEPYNGIEHCSTAVYTCMLENVLRRPFYSGTRDSR